MGQRRKARAAALQALFQLEFSIDGNQEHGLALYRSQFHRDNETWDYTHELVCGVLENKSSIDEIINGHSRNWAISRMPKADLNILRLAIFEMMYSKNPVPPSVVINEAVEIAKKYGESESPQFINAILDKAYLNSKSTQPPPLEAKETLQS